MKVCWLAAAFRVAHPVGWQGHSMHTHHLGCLTCHVDCQQDSMRTRAQWGGTARALTCAYLCAGAQIYQRDVCMAAVNLHGHPCILWLQVIVHQSALVQILDCL